MLKYFNLNVLSYGFSLSNLPYLVNVFLMFLRLLLYHFCDLYLSLRCVLICVLGRAAIILELIIWLNFDDATSISVMHSLLKDDSSFMSSSFFMAFRNKDLSHLIFFGAGVSNILFDFVGL